MSNIVVVGAGLAGLFTALKLAPRPVILVSPTPLGEGASSHWAQGGIAAAVGKGDRPEKHGADTIRAGSRLVDPEMAHLLAREAPQRIEDLLQYGVPFDQDLEGVLKLSREAAHGERRIVRVRGDMAGKAIMACLISAVRTTPSIRVLEGYSATQLVLGEETVYGLYVKPQPPHLSSRTPHFLAATDIILATGGIGALYAITTNPQTSRGDGLALAARAGAILADLEFMQFHPTAIEADLDPVPLATEALRGDGARLVNRFGDFFMERIHDQGDLAPRDIVARAVHREKMSGRGVFLDCRTALGETMKEEYPTVFAKCQKIGIDPARELIPVVPAAHYHMGGILTDNQGRTSVDGLWACGECASTGVHGANRLASNSLLEALVFGARIAEAIEGSSRPAHRAHSAQLTPPERRQAHHSDRVKQAIQKLRQAMSDHVGVIRNEKGLYSVLEEISRIKDQGLESPPLENMILVSELILSAALERRESRGGHFRSDYPVEREAFAKRSFSTLEGLQERLSNEGGKAVQNSARRSNLMALGS